MKKTRYFVENVTNLENRYLVGNEHGYAKREDAERARIALAADNTDRVYTIYVRGERTQQG